MGPGKKKKKHKGKASLRPEPMEDRLSDLAKRLKAYADRTDLPIEGLEVCARQIDTYVYEEDHRPVSPPAYVPAEEHWSSREKLDLLKSMQNLGAYRSDKRKRVDSTQPTKTGPTIFMRKTPEGYEEVDVRTSFVTACYGCNVHFAELDEADGLIGLGWKYEAFTLCPACCLLFVGYVSQETVNEVLNDIESARAHCKIQEEGKEERSESNE